MRNKKKYFTCYVLLCQQIVSTAKISAMNEATIDLKTLQVYSSKNELVDLTEVWREETCHVRQTNLSETTFCFQKTLCMTTYGNEQKFMKQNFQMIRQ